MYYTLKGETTPIPRATMRTLRIVDGQLVATLITDETVPVEYHAGSLPTGRARPCSLEVALSVEERKHIDMRAEALGLRPAEYVRRMVLAD